MPTGQNQTPYQRANTSMAKTTTSTDAKFTLIEQIGNSKTSVEKQTIILHRENFWITTLRTLTPLGFNQELN